MRIPPSSGAGRRQALALRTPSCAWITDGPDIAVRGRLQPSCERTGVHAATAHTPQQKNQRLPRRLRAAPGALQGGVGPAVGGDRPPPGDLSPHRKAVVDGRGAAPFPTSDGAAGPGQRPGPGPSVHRLRRRAGEELRPRGLPTNKLVS